MPHTVDSRYRARTGALGLELDLDEDPLASQVNVALVHDWLPVYSGAERVLAEMIAAFPHSDVYSLIDFLPQNERAFLKGKTVQTSFIQRLPAAPSKYRYYLPFAPIAIEQFDLNSYDVIVSSSYVVAKGVLTTADQLHISYVHSPVRYAWDLHFQYLEESGMARGLRSAIARCILHYMRVYDAVSANRVDQFVANSKFVARRIWKTYRRPAQVIYPPVDTDAFRLHPDKENFYVTMSRLVPYKRVDMVVEAFSEMPDKELVVIGDGPDFRKIAAKAGLNVTMLGYRPFESVKHYLQRARAFVFAAEEDFGIAPVEAQACGTPVIAYGKGGVLETVSAGETGVFFHEQTKEALKDSVHEFESMRDELDPHHIRASAERFSRARFQREFADLIQQEIAKFMAGTHPGDGSLR